MLSGRGPDFHCGVVDGLARSIQARMVEPAYTQTQGQHLAFIHYSTKIHGVPPAEADFQRYFKVPPPAIHQVIVTLDKRGFIERTPGVGPRSDCGSRDELRDRL